MIAWSGLVIWISIRELSSQDDLQANFLENVTRCANLLASAMVIALILIRIPPAPTATCWRSRLSGVIGSVAPMAFLGLPRASREVSNHTLSQLVIFFGTILTLVVLVWLGRSFSVLPQARRLVTTGPYRLVRHPLYLAEFVSLFGMMMHFAQPLSAIVWVGAVLAQFPRMYFEERVLLSAFPEYAAYRRATPALLPFLRRT